jgi:hypothetical protein
LQTIGSRVGDKYYSVCSVEQEPSTGGIHRLSRHGDELQPKVVASEGGRLQRKQIKKDGAILVRVHGDHFSATLGISRAVKDEEVRCLTSGRRAVVDDLYSDDTLAAIDFNHFRFSSFLNFGIGEVTNHYTSVFF